MLRVLLIILSVVAIILAYVLQQPLLYIVALGLLAGSATLTTVKMKKRHDDVPESFMKAPEEQIEDLNALGILEIRAKDEAAVETDRQSTSALNEDSELDILEPDRSPEETDSEGFTTHETGESPKQPALPEEPPNLFSSVVSSGDIVGEVRTRKPRARIMVSEVAEGQDGDVIIPALRSLRAGLDAYTVCLLRQELSPLRYHVEAIVSQNSYARGQGSFAANDPLIAGYRPLEPVIHEKVGADGYSKKKLGYYHESISVRQAAMVALATTEDEEPYLLVVDTMKDGSLETKSASRLLEQYAHLFSAIFESKAAGDLEQPAVQAERKSRRAIIADEMQQARKKDHPLALALVFLNRGEELGDVNGHQLHEMETVFEARLKEVAKEGRVEQFGELTYGVFYSGDAKNLESWAKRLQSSFLEEEGQLQGGVSVGVATMQERHESPDELRSDATAALQEAFQTGECTIVE